jgi:hypothetical protein
MWRHRNQGVEGMNGVLSLRYNKFNNRGGNKGRSKDGINEKCEAFEVLGSSMSRLIMWQLGLGDKIFEQDQSNCTMSHCHECIIFELPIACMSSNDFYILIDE